jgi:hypothetical protein
MGACEYAPMCRVDHRYVYDLTPDKIDTLIAERKSVSKSHLPASGEGGAPAPGGEAQPAPRKRTVPRKKKSSG